MARPRFLIPLIVCTFLLATVITAFRLRDLATKEVSSRKNPFLEKCSRVDCERDEGERYLSVSAQKVKDVSSRRSYEDVKKAVKEKQHTINEKKKPLSDRKDSIFIDGNSDGDDDDDDSDDIEAKKHLGAHQEIRHNQPQKYKNAFSRANLFSEKREFSTATKLKQKKESPAPGDKSNKDDNDDHDGNIGDADDEDDDEDDEDEDGEDGAKDTVDESDDADSENDDSDKNKNYGNELDNNDSDDESSIIIPIEKSKLLSHLSKQQKENDRKHHTETKQKQKVVDEDGDDDDDDDDDYDDDKGDENGDTNSVDDGEHDALTVITDNLKEKQKQYTPKSKYRETYGAKNLYHEDDSEDDDDDDGDDDEDSDDENSEDDKPLIKNLSIQLAKVDKFVQSTKLDSRKDTNNAPTKQSSGKLHDSGLQNKNTQSKYLKSDITALHKDTKDQTTKKGKIDNIRSEIKESSKHQQNFKQDLKANDIHENVGHLVIQSHDTKKPSGDQNAKSQKEVAQKRQYKEENVEKDETRIEKDAKKKTDFKPEHTKSRDKDSSAVKKLDKQKIGDSKSHKEKDVMQHASSALYRKNNFLQSDFEDFYAFLPSFAPNFSRIHNPECRRQGQILTRQLRGTKLWALNMLDASGKISSGILQGNGNQLGNFDQCLESRARVRLDSGHVVRIHGKYCLAQIEARADIPELKLPVHLAQARNLLKSKIDDPGHMIPRFSLLNWGICLPSSCESEDAEFVLRDSLRHYHLAGLHLKIRVDPLNCYTSSDDDDLEQWLEPPTLATITLFLAIALLVFYATLKDFLVRRRNSAEADEEPKEQSEDQNTGDDDNEKQEDIEKSSTTGSDEGIVSSFSLYRSYPKLVRDGSSEDIACLHGIRAIGSFFILVAHKIIPVANKPFINRAAFTELSNSPLSVPLRLGSLLTDAFLLMSGALTAHRLSADHDDEAAPGWIRRFLARYARLTPPLLLTVLFYAYVWERLAQGPLWGTLVAHNARLCRQSWWWNLLYVQNFMPFDEICATHTYQLALDMQLALVAAALVWSLRTRPVLTSLALTALQAVTAYMRYYTTVQHRLSLLVYHGASVSQLYRSATLTYSLPLHRSTPYIAGVALGVLLQRRPNIKLSLLVTLPCWLACAACCAGCLYAALDAASPATRYSATAAGAYVSLAPVSLAAALAWLIYVTHSGNAEWINRILRARVLVIVARLSYALYLCQFIVFFTNTGTVKTAKEFTIFSILDIKEFTVLFAITTAVTLTLVIPMQSLSKYVMAYQFNTTEPEVEKEENSEKSKEIRDEAIQIDVTPKQEEAETEIEGLRYESHNGKRLMAHREFLEEILEVEVEYESQRNERDEGLEEILEEEEDELTEEEVGEEEMVLEEDLAGEAEAEVIRDEDIEDEMEIVDHEEVEGGQEDFWGRETEEEMYVPRRLSREDDASEQDRSDWMAGQGSRISHYR